MNRLKIRWRRNPSAGGFLRRFPGNLLIRIPIYYVLVCLVLAGCQRHLIYQPRRDTRAALQIKAELHHSLVSTNAEGARIGWWRPAKGGNSRGIVMITHGNAGCAVDRAYIWDPIQSAVPMDIFTLEYPGYADRPGRPSQKFILSAAEEMLTQIRQSFPDRPLYLVGESLGSGVASYLASAHPTEIRGVILLAPYNNFTSACKAHYPWIPVTLILQDKYPNDAWLKQYNGPLAVVVGESDRVVPPNLGRALHQSYQGPKRLWSFPEDHFGACDRDPEWWRDAFEFLEACSAKRP